MEKGYMDIIEKEIKMTLGCTDPGAVAYALAYAAKELEEEVLEIELKLSKSLYKNALSVGIPYLKKSGIHYAALLGAIIKKPENKLEVLKDVDELTLKILDDWIDKVKIIVDYIEDVQPLYLEVSCVGETKTVKVILKDDYDNIYQVYKNGKLTFENNITQDKLDDCVSLDLLDIYNYSINLNKENEESILYYESINKKVIDSGKHLNAIENTPLEDALVRIGRKYVYEGCSKRMAGERVPVLSLWGSGNLGLTSMLSVSGMCDFINVDDTVRSRALTLSILTAICIKSKMNRVTIVCGTAIAGAAGSAAATVYLLGGDYNDIIAAINSLITSSFGILCDGAKDSCAMKTSLAVSNGIICGIEALKGNKIEAGRGIIHKDINKTFSYMGYINNNGMNQVDNIILDIIKKV